MLSSRAPSRGGEHQSGGGGARGIEATRHLLSSPPETFMAARFCACKLAPEPRGPSSIRACIGPKHWGIHVSDFFARCVRALLLVSMDVRRPGRPRRSRRPSGRESVLSVSRRVRQAIGFISPGRAKHIFVYRGRTAGDSAPDPDRRGKPERFPAAPGPPKSARLHNLLATQRSVWARSRHDPMVAIDTDAGHQALSRE